MYAHEWHPWPASSASQVKLLYSNLFENIFKLNLNEISAFGTRKCTAPNGFHISYIFHDCWLLPALILLGRQQDRQTGEATAEYYNPELNCTILLTVSSLSVKSRQLWLEEVEDWQ